MEKVQLVLLLGAIGACGGHADGGGFTEPMAPAPAKLEIDAVTYPERVADDADDLNGDGVADNRFGTIVGALFASGEATSEARQALAAGMIAPWIEIDGQAVAWHESNAATASVHGAWSRTTSFASDPARAAREPAKGTVRVVLFGQAIELPLVGLEITLHPDASGYAGEVHGAIARADVEQHVLPQVFAGIERVVNANPAAHADMIRLLDTDHDGTVTLADLDANPFVHAVIAPDVQLFDANGAWAPDARNATPDALSVGFAFHAKPALN